MPGFSQDVVTLLFKADTRQAEAAFKRMQMRGRGMVQWTRNLRAGMLGMNNMVMGAGAVMVAAGIGIRSAVRSTEAYSNAQANLRSVLVSSNIPIREQQHLMRVADVQATRYGIGMAETSRGMVDMAEAGFNVHEVMRYYPIATQFATAANMNLADAVNMLQGSMHQFNLQSEEDARQVAGGLLVAARISSTSVEELQHAFRYAAVEASGLGYNATEVTGALAGLSIMNLRGSVAGTRLRAVLAGLNRITERTETIASESGVSIEELNHILYDAAGNTLPLRDAFRNLMGLFARLPSRMERNRLAVSMFGRYGMSAGMMFANMNGQAEQWEEILDRISDRQGVANTMTQAAEENMRGFGAQMRFAKVAAEGFGIAFGEIFTGADQAGEGFGRYLLDLSVATRLADASARTNGQAREQWEALTPAMREQGAQMRETLIGLSQLIIYLGKAAAWVGRFAGEYPRLTLAILAVGSVLRPFIGVLGSGPGLVGTLGRVTTAMRATTIGTVAFGTGATLAIVAAGGAIAQYGAQFVASMGNERDELNRSQGRVDAWLTAHNAAWVSSIPVIGQWANQLGIVIDQTNELTTVERTLAAQRESSRRRANMPVISRISERAEQIRQNSGGSINRLDSERMAAIQTGGLDMRDMAALLRSQAGNTDSATEQFRTLMSSSLRGSALDVRVGEFRRVASGMSDTDVSLESRALTNNGRGNVNQIARSLGELTNYMASEGMDLSLLRARHLGGDFRTQATQGPGTGMEARQDARARDELITGLREREQADRNLQPMLQGMLENFTRVNMAGADPASAIDAAVVRRMPNVEATVSVQLDRREIGRAVTEFTLNELQRQGISSQPGARRQAAQGIPTRTQR